MNLILRWKHALKTTKVHLWVVSANCIKIYHPLNRLRLNLLKQRSLNLTSTLITVITIITYFARRLRQCTAHFNKVIIMYNKRSPYKGTPGSLCMGSVCGFDRIVIAYPLNGNSSSSIRGNSNSGRCGVRGRRIWWRECIMLCGLDLSLDPRFSSPMAPSKGAGGPSQNLLWASCHMFQWQGHATDRPTNRPGPALLLCSIVRCIMIL